MFAILHIPSGTFLYRIIFFNIEVNYFKRYIEAHNQLILFVTDWRSSELWTEEQWLVWKVQSLSYPIVNYLIEEFEIIEV